jgi:uncharacterized protein YxjI
MLVSRATPAAWSEVRPVYPNQIFVLSQKLMSLKGDLWIEDSLGNQVYRVDGQYLSLRGTHTLVDTAGTAWYSISQSLAHLHRTFEIKRGEQVVATVQQAIMRLLGDRFTITLANGGQLTVKGDWIDREFHVMQGTQDVIFASRRLLSLRDKYGIQIAPGFDVPFGLAIVVALERMEMQDHSS